MTEQKPHPDFPSDETLAAFIDGRLEPEMRRRVIEHMATCEECRDVVIGAHSMREEAVGPFRRRPWALAALAAAAVIAVVALLVSPLRDRILMRPRSGLVALAAAAPPQRNIEGRLSGFPYRPLKPVTRGAGDEDMTLPENLKLLSVAAQVASVAKEKPTPENLHAYGVSLLMLGKWDAAVRTLEDALRKETAEEDVPKAIQKSDDGALLSDLSAALLQRYRMTAQVTDGLAAVSAADRAYRLQETAAAAFNRALAIDGIHGGEAALEAWHDFLKLEPGGGWADDAKQHVRRLKTTGKSTSDAAGAMERAFASGDPAAIAAASRAGSFRAITFAVEVALPEWAAARERGDLRGATRALLAARTIGSSVSQSSGDTFVGDCVRAIDLAEHDPERMAALQRGHALYAAGRSGYRIDRIVDAERAFRRAMEDLRAAGSPLFLLAGRYVGGCQAYEKRFDDAIATLRPLEASFAPGEYPTAFALLQWAIGVVEIDRGAPGEAIVAYEKALSAFDRAGQRGNSASVHGLLAQAFEYIGDPERAWLHRRASIVGLQELASERFYPVATEAALAAASAGFLTSAGILQNAAVRCSEDSGNPMELSEALADRARIAYKLNDRGAAEQDLKRARRAAAAIRDPRRRDAIDVILALADAEIEASDPAAAEERLKRVIEANVETGDRFALVTLLERVGSLEERQSRDDEAADRYRAALGELRQQCATVTDPLMRGRYLEIAARVTDALVALLWRHGRAEDALQVVESSHARNWTAMSVPPAPISLAAIQARLTAGHAIVEFASLPDVTLAWVIAHDRITPVELPVSSREIAEAVRTLNGRDPVDARGVLSALYDRLFAPLGPALSAQQLTIVPDKVLNAVPFPALLNRTARRYLIEQHVLTMVPSATVWLACDRRPSANTARPDGDLLFAAGAPSNGAGALPNLQRERNAIVALYPGARMANGSKTTLLEQIGEHEVVHFAGHGIRDSSHPEFSSLVFSQARLYAHEIAARSFARTRVVVLSACGTRDPSWSDQALFSVPEAFLAANVREVVAALDAVDDGAAADIVISFHRHLRHGETVAAALRSAQLEAIGRTAPVREWASWVVIGA